jgi:TnsA endonuclease N terminal
MNEQQLSQLDIKLLPGRNIPPKSRALTGQISLRDGTSAPFESSLERDALIRLDFDVAGRTIRSQPFTIEYLIEGRARRYTPDILVEFCEHEITPVTVIEVKPKAVLEDRWAEFEIRFKIVRELCRRNKWNFEILTEEHILHDSFVANATFLRKYIDLPVDPARAYMLLQVLIELGAATPNQLLVQAFRAPETRPNAMWILWTLVANKVIGFNMSKPLNMNVTSLQVIDVNAVKKIQEAVNNSKDEVHI